jgi:DNA-binding NtrC family response regulator
MPEMDGIELFNRIEKEDSKAKVCFFSASEHLASVYKELFKNSPDRFFLISKPISVSQMTKQIKHFLNRS